MPLYRIRPNNRSLSQVARKEFANEEELQILVEENLQELLGIRLIAREYPIPNGRIDTLGLDEDGLPVIIEYKWKKELRTARRDVVEFFYPFGTPQGELNYLVSSIKINLSTLVPRY